MSVLTTKNAFPNGAFPQHLAGLTKTVQSFIYPGGVQPNPVPSQASSFNPATLITGDGGFFRSDMGVTQSLGSVSAWADQSSFSNNLTVGNNAPAFFANGFAGPGIAGSFPGIRFNVTRNSDNLVGGTTYGPVFTTSLFALLIPLTPGSSGFWLKVGRFNVPETVADAVYLGQSGSPIIGAAYSNTSAILGNGGSNLSVGFNGAPILFGLVCDGTNANVWLNGSVVGSATAFSSQIGNGVGDILQFGYDNVSSGGAMMLAFGGFTQKVLVAKDWANLVAFSNANFGTLLPHLWYANAFPNGAFPQHLSGQTNTVQSFLFPGAVQPATGFPGGGGSTLLVHTPSFCRLST